MYWYEDSDMIYSYLEASNLEFDRKNRELWIQGRYIHEAFNITLSNAFSKKGAIPVPYLTEPFVFVKNEQEKTEKESERLYKQMKGVIAQFDKDAQTRNLERLQKFKNE